MSDLFMNELEDFTWEELCQSGDCVVPDPSGELVYDHSLQNGRCKKPRHVVSAPKYVHEPMEMDQERQTTLENSSWSDDTHCVIPMSCDTGSVKNASSLVSESTTTSGQCCKRNNVSSVGSGFCANDPILVDTATVDGNSHSYPLGHFSRTEDVLSFFDTNHEDKGCSDLLCSWPERGNSEDVDRIFRSCDSTFGLGASNKDELGWFSPSGAISDEFGTPGHQSFVNASGSSHHKDDLMLEEQIYMHKMHSEHKNKPEVKRGGVYLENVGEISQSAFPSIDFQQQKQNLPVASGYLQSNFPHMDTRYIHPSDQNSVQPNRHESASISSGLDEISLTTASFQQLQCVMQQFDLKTKLCIRDSLYRLARSAEERHKYANLNHVVGASVANGANKCHGYMDMEMETNRVDQSMAHLLFYRLTTDSSPVVPAVESSFVPRLVFQGSC